MGQRYSFPPRRYLELRLARKTLTPTELEAFRKAVAGWNLSQLEMEYKYYHNACRYDAMRLPSAKMMQEFRTGLEAAAGAEGTWVSKSPSTTISNAINALYGLVKQLSTNSDRLPTRCRRCKSAGRAQLFRNRWLAVSLRDRIQAFSGEYFGGSRRGEKADKRACPRGVLCLSDACCGKNRNSLNLRRQRPYVLNS
ncbi:MAG: hypothetical protein JWN34_5519 [Bryobacterales bacterium]|nr:hypothetical protein [Bryobacterales bacterium]